MQHEIKVNAIFNMQTIKNDDVKQIIETIIEEEIGGDVAHSGDIEILESQGNGEYNVRIFTENYDFKTMKFKHHRYYVLIQLQNDIEDIIVHWDAEALHECIKEGEEKFKLENEPTYEKEDLELSYNSNDCCVCLDCYDENKKKVFIHCGHSFCNECHSNMCKGSRKCPYCREDFEDAEGDGESYTIDDINELIEEENTELLIKITDIEKLTDALILDAGYAEALGYDEHVTDYNKIMVLWR
jgi:hypothetical protein